MKTRNNKNRPSLYSDSITAITFGDVSAEFLPQRQRKPKASSLREGDISKDLPVSSTRCILYQDDVNLSNDVKLLFKRIFSRKSISDVTVRDKSLQNLIDMLEKREDDVPQKDAYGERLKYPRLAEDLTQYVGSFLARFTLDLNSNIRNKVQKLVGIILKRVLSVSLENRNDGNHQSFSDIQKKEIVLFLTIAMNDSNTSTASLARQLIELFFPLGKPLDTYVSDHSDTNLNFALFKLIQVDVTGKLLSDDENNKYFQDLSQTVDEKDVALLRKHFVSEGFKSVIYFPSHHLKPKEHNHILSSYIDKICTLLSSSYVKNSMLLRNGQKGAENVLSLRICMDLIFNCSILYKKSKKLTLAFKDLMFPQKFNPQCCLMAWKSVFNVDIDTSHEFLVTFIGKCGELWLYLYDLSEDDRIEAIDVLKKYILPSFRQGLTLLDVKATTSSSSSNLVKFKDRMAYVSNVFRIFVQTCADIIRIIVRGNNLDDPHIFDSWFQEFDWGCTTKEETSDLLVDMKNRKERTARSAELEDIQQSLVSLRRCSYTHFTSYWLYLYHRQNENDTVLQRLIEPFLTLLNYDSRILSLSMKHRMRYDLYANIIREMAEIERRAFAQPGAYLVSLIKSCISEVACSGGKLDNVFIRSQSMNLFRFDDTFVTCIETSDIGNIFRFLFSHLEQPENCKDVMYETKYLFLISQSLKCVQTCFKASTDNPAYLMLCLIVINRVLVEELLPSDRNLIFKYFFCEIFSQDNTTRDTYPTVAAMKMSQELMARSGGMDSDCVNSFVYPKVIKECVLPSLKSLVCESTEMNESLLVDSVIIIFNAYKLLRLCCGGDRLYASDKDKRNIMLIETFVNDVKSILYSSQRSLNVQIRILNTVISAFMMEGWNSDKMTEQWFPSEERIVDMVKYVTTNGMSTTTLPQIRQDDMGRFWVSLRYSHCFLNHEVQSQIVDCLKSRFDVLVHQSTEMLLSTKYVSSKLCTEHEHSLNDMYVSIDSMLNTFIRLFGRLKLNYTRKVIEKRRTKLSKVNFVHVVDNVGDLLDWCYKLLLMMDLLRCKYDDPYCDTSVLIDCRYKTKNLFISLIQSYMSRRKDKNRSESYDRINRSCVIIFRNVLNLHIRNIKDVGVLIGIHGSVYKCLMSSRARYKQIHLSKWISGGDAVDESLKFTILNQFAVKNATFFQMKVEVLVQFVKQWLAEKTEEREILFLNANSNVCKEILVHMLEHPGEYDATLVSNTIKHMEKAERVKTKRSQCDKPCLNEILAMVESQLELKPCSEIIQNSDAILKFVSVNKLCELYHHCVDGEAENLVTISFLLLELNERLVKKSVAPLVTDDTSSSEISILLGNVISYLIPSCLTNLEKKVDFKSNKVSEETCAKFTITNCSLSILANLCTDADKISGLRFSEVQCQEFWETVLCTLVSLTVNLSNVYSVQQSCVSQDTIMYQCTGDQIILNLLTMINNVIKLTKCSSSNPLPFSDKLINDWNEIYSPSIFVSLLNVFCRHVSPWVEHENPLKFESSHQLCLAIRHIPRSILLTHTMKLRSETIQSQMNKGRFRRFMSKDVCTLLYTVCPVINGFNRSGSNEKMKTISDGEQNASFKIVHNIMESVCIAELESAVDVSTLEQGSSKDALLAASSNSSEEGHTIPSFLCDIFEVCGESVNSFLESSANADVQFATRISFYSDDDGQMSVEERQVALHVKAYVMGWFLFLTLVEKISSRSQESDDEEFSDGIKVVLGRYTEFIRERDYLSTLVPILFHMMNGNDFDQEFKGDLSKSSDDFILNHCDIQNMDKWLSITSVQIYSKLMKLLPALVRQWWKSEHIRQKLKKSSIDHIQAFTSTHLTPILWKDEVKNILEYSRRNVNSINIDDTLTVSVLESVREVKAVYKVDDSFIELKMAVPANFPLGQIVVTSGKQIGVKSSVWRNWLLQLTTFLQHQNGRISQAIHMWKCNVDRRFSGVEECYICYFVLQASTGQMPRIPCRTCKHKFHSSCLYKWFQSSQNATCPMCRGLF